MSKLLSMRDSMKESLKEIEEALRKGSVTGTDRMNLMRSRENLIRQLLETKELAKVAIPDVEIDTEEQIEDEPEQQVVTAVTGFDPRQFAFSFDYAASHLKIDYRHGMQKTKDRHGPMLLTEAQLKIIAVIYELAFVRKEPVRIILLKSRQLGCTTLLLALAVWLCVTRPGFKVLFIIDKDTHITLKRDNLLSWIAQFEKLYTGMPKVKRGGRGNKVILLDNGSAIFLDSAMSPNPGTSERVDMCITSEETKWVTGKPEAVKASLYPGIPDAEFTFIIRESTANGVGIFQRDFIKAHHGKSTFTPIFVPWYVSEEYSNEGDNFGRHAIMAPFSEPSEYDDINLEDGPDLTELEYQRLYKLSIEQLRWRRRKIDEMGSRVMFDQEYPTTWRHAFRSTSMGYFSPSLLDVLTANARPPVFVGEIFHEEDDLPSQAVHYSILVPMLEKNPTGPLRMWMRPIVGMDYYIAVDCSEGLSAQTDEGEDPDWTVITVMDRKGEIVAVWKDRIKPEEAWVPMCLLGIYYNMANLNGELQNAQALLFQIKSSGYPHMMIHPTSKRNQRSVEERTWTRMNRGNRNLILQSFRAALREDPTRYPSESLLDECASFIIHKNGKPAAGIGFHDDELLSACHCDHGRRVMLGLWNSVQAEPEPEPDVKLVIPDGQGEVALWQTSLTEQMDIGDLFLMS